MTGGRWAMSTVQHPRRREVRQRPAAGPMRLRLRWLLARASRPFARASQSRRSRGGRARPGRTRAWHRSRLRMRVARWATYVVAGLFVLWVLRALYVVLWSRPASFPMNVEKACKDTDFNCDSLAGILLPISSLALASTVFLLYRHTRVHRPFVRMARDKPREVVQTAGSIIGEVVGRDELCQVMIDDLRDRGTRRPHVVIGGVGTGKTALLVRLTKLLAERGRCRCRSGCATPRTGSTSASWPACGSWPRPTPSCCRTPKGRRSGGSWSRTTGWWSSPTAWRRRSSRVRSRRSGTPWSAWPSAGPATAACP